MGTIWESGSKTPGSSEAANDWSVDIQEKGRCGSVNYRETSGILSFYWEIGGGDTLAIINVGDEASWRTRHPWAVSRRAEILRRVADEVIRQKAPGSRAEINEPAGWINICGRQRKQPPLRSSSGRFPFLIKPRLMVILALVVLVVAAAAVALKSMLSIKSPHGIPTGQSVRAANDIATLIQTLEPYVPSLHRNPGNDRYRLALFVSPVDGRSPGKTIPIGRRFRAEELRLARILGCDGRLVWVLVNTLTGVNLSTGQLIGAADLRQANPALDETWEDARRFTFEQRLRVTLPDRQRVLEVDAETLQAFPVPDDRQAAKLPFDLTLADFLSSGARPNPTEWLGLHSPKAAERDFKPNSWLGPLNRAEDAKELRRFYRGVLGPELAKAKREILSLTALLGDEYLNAAFVRAGAKADPLRFSNPDSFLMVYTSGPGLQATLMVARVDTAGKIVWKVDTGLDRFKLQQILPDARFPAFVGTRPPVPDKVPEPLLAIIDTQSGAVSTSSLWR